MTASHKRKGPRQRKVRTALGRTIHLRNLPEKGRLHDLYHWLLNSDRFIFSLTLIGAYFGTNVIFALAYLLVGGVENMRDGSFLDAFFFSVQTMATIGYGRLVPVGVLANFLVTIEAGLGLFGMATAASLLFARFTRATAGVRFSHNALVTRFDGQKVLMFRIANERVARITEANVYLVAGRQEKTKEGETYRRLYDLPPTRSLSPVFELSWTVMHVIDEKSPLAGCTEDSLADNDTTITVVFTGHHEGFQQRVHARFTYESTQILWDHRFADMIHRPEDGPVVIDYAFFDEVRPIPADERLMATD